MKRKTMTLPAMHRAAEIRAGSVDEAARTAEVVFTTGARVRRRRFFSEDFDEELEVSKKAIRLERLNAGAPFLDTHDALRLRSILGVVVEGSARIEGGKGVATIRFSSRDEVEPVFRDIRDGIIRNISVGYRVHKFEIEKKDGAPELRRAVDWEPMEISAVPIGADAGAQVRAGGDEFECVLEEIDQPKAAQPARKRNSKMKDEEMTLAGGGDAAELERRAMLDDYVKRYNLGAEFRTKHERSSAAKIKDAVLEELRRIDNEDAGGITNISDPCRSASLDDPDFRRRAMAGALVEQMLPGFTGPEGAAAYRGMKFSDFARLCLEERGRSTRAMRPATIIREALNLRAGGVGFGAQGSGDFVATLGDAARMFAESRYRLAPPVLKTLASEMGFTDFRAHKSVRGSAFPALQKVNEHGEITHGTLADSGDEIALARYGRIVGLTFQAITNDSVGMFADLMTSAAEGALATEANLMAAAVEANPLLADGLAVFAAGHGNIAAAGAAPSETTLTEARKAMRGQTGISGERIAPVPRFLLVPPALETVSEKLVSQVQATKTADANVFSILSVLVEPRLADETAWYLVADPAQVSGLRFGYLDSEGGPVVDERQGWEYDGIEFRVRMSFATGFTDFRGWYKNPGI
jgi:hypothetical protein